jgi:hypothetical protein
VVPPTQPVRALHQELFARREHQQNGRAAQRGGQVRQQLQQLGRGAGDLVEDQDERRLARVDLQEAPQDRAAHLRERQRVVLHGVRERRLGEADV